VKPRERLLIMVFDPKLQGGVAYNQPVSQPNAMEAVAGLFNFGMSSISASGGDAPKPTQDEKFAMAMREFESSKGGAFSWDRKGMREFIFKYPQFTSQAKAWGEGQAIVPNSPEETAISATNKWFETPEGIVTVAKSNALKPEEREAFIIGEYSKVVQEEAEIAKVTRDAARLTAAGTLDQAYWDTLKATSKSFASNTIDTIVEPIMQEVMLGNTVDIDPKLVADLGLNYTSVSVNNINAFLQDTRSYLDKSFQGKYVDNFGKESLPSEAWNKEVLGQIDGLLEVGKQFDTPTEQVAFTEAILKNKALHLLDENGLGMTVGLINIVPPELMVRMVGTLAALDPIIAKTVSDSTGKALFSHKVITGNVANSSTSEAETIANQTVTVLDKAFVPEMFTAFDESLKKTGNSVVDESTFRSVIGNHADEINRIVATDSETRTRLSDFIVGDIQSNLSLLENSLPSTMDLVVNSQGTFTLVYVGGPNASRAEAAMGRDAYVASEMAKAKAALPQGISVEGLNSKIATLGVLGPMGKEISEAIGLLNEPAKPKDDLFGEGLKKAKPFSSTGGEVTKSSNGGVVASLMTTESGGNFKAKNNVVGAGGIPGHFGRLQFGVARLNEAKAAGVMPGGMTPQQFLQNPEVQVAVEQWHINDIVSFAESNDITKYIGSNIKGVPVTMDGLIAVAHLGGKGGLKKFVESGGEYNPADANGTSLLDYLGTHQGSTGGFAGSAPAYGERENAPLSVGIDSAGVPIPESVRGSQGSSAGLSVGALTFESPEVQEVVAKAQTEPEAAIAMAKEILKKPMDPGIKSLIEALVKIGERV
jgi:hypothetical protein